MTISKQFLAEMVAAIIEGKEGQAQASFNQCLTEKMKELIEAGPDAPKRRRPKIVSTITVLHESEGGDIFIKDGPQESRYMPAFKDNSWQVSLSQGTKDLFEYRFFNPNDPNDEQDEKGTFHQRMIDFRMVVEQNPGCRIYEWAVEYDLNLSCVVLE